MLSLGLREPLLHRLPRNARDSANWRYLPLPMLLELVFQCCVPTKMYRRSVEAVDSSNKVSVSPIPSLSLSLSLSLGLTLLRV